MARARSQAGGLEPDRPTLGVRGAHVPRQGTRGRAGGARGSAGGGGGRRPPEGGAAGRGCGGRGRGLGRLHGSGLGLERRGLARRPRDRRGADGSSTGAAGLRGDPSRGLASTSRARCRGRTAMDAAPVEHDERRAAARDAPRALRPGRRGEARTGARPMAGIRDRPLRGRRETRRWQLPLDALPVRPLDPDPAAGHVSRAPVRGRLPVPRARAAGFDGAALGVDDGAARRRLLRADRPRALSDIARVRVPRGHAPRAGFGGSGQHQGGREPVPPGGGDVCRAHGCERRRGRGGASEGGGGAGAVPR
jgi:hypothetical protein